MITGGCLCGAVRYELRGELGFQLLCQCRGCQRAAGSGSAAHAQAWRRDLTLTGETRTYHSDNGAGSPRIRVFCPQCGTRIHGGNPTEDFVTLSAGTLDDPDLFRPTQIICADEARPWDRRSIPAES